MIDDRRTDKGTRPWGYMVATDAFMSGWGGASGGRSLYAVACLHTDDAAIIEDNFRNRSEFRRARWVLSLKADGTPRVRMGPSDHLAIVDRGTAWAFYTRGYFADQACARRNRELANR